jgi:hypothetical protein
MVEFWVTPKPIISINNNIVNKDFKKLIKKAALSICFQDQPTLPLALEIIRVLNLNEESVWNIVGKINKDINKLS